MDEKLAFAYRAFRGVMRGLLRIFFREIACEGAHRIPVNSRGLIVAWHPNGLIDPALIFSFFPRRVVFGARHGLLQWPILGRLFKAIGTVPIYRAADKSDKNRSDRFNANQKSLDSLASELAAGSFSALFPEGLSHDQSHLARVKTGAARLFYRACALTPSGAPHPIIVPIGLYYDRKNIFRSRVLIQIYDPIELPRELRLEEQDDINAQDERSRTSALTELIKKTLTETARATDDWELHHLMHRARKLIRAERAYRAGKVLGRPDIREYELGFARVWYAYQTRAADSPTKTKLEIDRLAAYDKLITATGIEDHEITSNPDLGSPLWIGLFILQLIVVYIFLPPILLIGYVINAVPYFLLKMIDIKYSVNKKDGASIKVIVGSVLFPFFWILASVLAVLLRVHVRPWFPIAVESPILLGTATFLFSVLSGYLALRYSEISRIMWHAIRIRATRHRRKTTLEELKSMRAALFDELIEMSYDLELPGTVARDGTVISGT